MSKISQILNMGNDVSLNQTVFFFINENIPQKSLDCLSLRLLSFEMISDNKFKMSFRMDEDKVVLDTLNQLSSKNDTNVKISFGENTEGNFMFYLTQCTILKITPELLNSRNNIFFSYGEDNGPVYIDVLFKADSSYESF